MTARRMKREFYVARASARARVLGASLLVTGVAWLLQIVGVLRLNSTSILSIFLIVLGLGLVLASKWGPFWNLAGLGFLVALFVAANSAAGVQVSGGVGDLTDNPRTVADLHPYAVGLGDLKINLTNLERTSGETVVRGHVDVGDLTVILPDASQFRLEAQEGFGDIYVLGTASRPFRFPNNRIYQTPGFASATDRWVLRVKVAVGDIKVEYGRP